MPMTFTAVIFDRDGVLTYFDVEEATAFFQPLLPISLEELVGYWDEHIAEEGAPATLADEEHFWHTFWATLNRELALSPSVYARLRAFTYASLLRPFADARRALQFCRSNGLKTAVLSNFSLASIEGSLKAVDLFGYVDVAAAAPALGVAKPDPRSYLEVSERLRVPPGACLFLDDERPCVEGARAAGMTAYLVDRAQSRADLEQQVVNSLDLLPQLLQ